MTEEGGEGDGAEEEEDESLHHYRVSVEVKSIGNFRRPAHVSIMFAYPYLGTSSPVRTKPVWVLANSEVRIDGGAASYECMLSRSSLRQKLVDHPLRVQVGDILMYLGGSWSVKKAFYLYISSVWLCMYVCMYAYE